LQERKRRGIDDGDDEDAALASPVGERIDILEDAEEVRLLNDERGDVLTLEARERRRQRASVGRAVRHLLEAHGLVARGGDRNFAVVRMHVARYEDALRLRFAIG